MNGGAIMKNYATGHIFLYVIVGMGFLPEQTTKKRPHTKRLCIERKTVVLLPRDSPLLPNASHLVANHF